MYLHVKKLKIENSSLLCTHGSDSVPKSLRGNFPSTFASFHFTFFEAYNRKVLSYIQRVQPSCLPVYIYRIVHYILFYIRFVLLVQ